MPLTVVKTQLKQLATSLISNDKKKFFQTRVFLIRN